MSGVDVEISGTGPSMPGYAALPESATRGVVVIHEIFGRQPEIDRVIDRFAAAGYAAVGPDLFHDGSKLGCIRRSLATISSGEGPIAERILQAQRWLIEHAKLDEARVGVIGFCIGGGLALAVGRQFAAVSTNYGDLPPAQVLRGSPPIIGCYGGRDRVFRRNADRLRERMSALGHEPQIHVFPTAGHSFLTDGHHPIANAASWPLFQIRWDPQVAEDGWAKILAFFEQSL
ncbi:Dienelactone hydrolase family protein [Enhygromyxa salina]|uniref:Dienelactone hydrolase family protein n=1 Tax=Enhygromyxa salina TaxID=215803 RepID=A0A0C1ZDL6_9BACT|nr:dienelactone hydrolase family protein [Enhygromyxa salina]KIG15719.1 Dienelactone hydrolase family protein [Enhygromyxa salina]